MNEEQGPQKMAVPGEPEEAQCLLLTDAERQRVRERFRATLAGLLELEVLRARHRARVDRALGRDCTNAGELDRRSLSDSEEGYRYRVLETSGCLRVTRSLSQEDMSDSARPRESWAWSTWSTEDLLPPPYQQDSRNATPDSQLRANSAQTDSKSQTSSGFCDDNCADDDDDEEDADGFSVADSGLSLDGRALPIQAGGGAEGCDPDLLSPLTAVIPTSSFLSVADLCPDSHWWHFSSALQAQVSLDPQYCLDLMAGYSRDVYRFPSPLHAVALLSPLHASLARSPDDEGRPNSRTLSRCLTASPWRRGNSPSSYPDRRRLDEVILELAYRHRRHNAMLMDSSSTSCLCAARVTSFFTSGIWQCPTLRSRSQRGSFKRGNTKNYPLSARLGVSATHTRSTTALQPTVMDFSGRESPNITDKYNCQQDQQET